MLMENRFRGVGIHGDRITNASSNHIVLSKNDIHSDDINAISDAISSDYMAILFAG